MNRCLAMIFTAAFALTGCGEPVSGVDQDAQVAKARAHDAVSAAEQAAQRIDDLSRAQFKEADAH